MWNYDVVQICKWIFVDSWQGLSGGSIEGKTMCQAMVCRLGSGLTYSPSMWPVRGFPCGTGKVRGRAIYVKIYYYFTWATQSHSFSFSILCSNLCHLRWPLQLMSWFAIKSVQLMILKRYLADLVLWRFRMVESDIDPIVTELGGYLVDITLQHAEPPKDQICQVSFQYHK